MNMHIEMSHQKNARKKRRVDSPAVEKAAESRAKFKPVTVSGISEGKLVTISPSQFGRLDVDAAYQRGETNMVAQIVRALQAGGKVLDPVTLCERHGSDKLWIIDGHQRVCAFQQLGVGFKAMVHESQSVEAEHTFFLAMNARRAVSANVIAKAWTGPSGALMRRANESYEHPLYDRVNFTQSSTDSRIAASSLTTALAHVVGVEHGSGKIDVVLSRIDLAMSKRLNVARAEHFLRLIGMVVPKGTLPYLVLWGLGKVANERWTEDAHLPTGKVIDRLRNKNWGADVVLVRKYMPVLIDSIRKVWK